MALVSVKTASGYAVKVVCDYCNEEIEYAIGGNYAWSTKSDMNKIVYLHKNCTLPFKKRGGHEKAYSSHNLTLLPLFLAVNLNIPVEFDGETENVVPEYRIIVKYPAYKF